MPSKPTPPPSRPERRAERRETDDSLLTERRKTDKEVARRDAIERDADAVLHQARTRADLVLGESRKRADHTLASEGASAGQRQAVRDERAEADHAVSEERLAADEELTDERRTRLRALAELFLLERGQTDEQLVLERARGDADLAARDQFMSMAAHDLRTLLGVITLSAEVQLMLAPEGEAGLKHREAAGKIRRVAAKMNRLIGDLVDVASIEANRLALAPADLDPRALLREAVEAFTPAAAAKGMALLTNAAASSPAWGDHDRTFQVLANLVSNAIKFTPEGGTIIVRAAPMGGEVRFSVADTGAGISLEHRESVFARFWQSGPDRRGQGLGLFISKSLVEAQGGRIWLESEPGEGSTFHFTLPSVAATGTGLPSP
jgi:signal transduction histidine kinase